MPAPLFDARDGGDRQRRAVFPVKDGSMKRFPLGAVLLLCTAPVWAAPAGAASARSAPVVPRDATPQEIELGKKAVAELEGAKSIHLLDANSSPAAKALLDKLNAFAQKLGAVSARPGIVYSVKVIEDKDVNAFTLPGGHIYVYRGLIDAVSSDDELAGVLAHEIGHNARMHALRGQKQSKKLSLASLAALAAMIAGGQNGANIAQFSQYALIGVLNGYGVGYEKEADSSGLEEMIRAGYNPSAMVTFMQRLQLIEERSPEVRLGIFQTHPPSDERADALLSQMKDDGIAFTPRAVTGAKVATVTEKPDRFTVALGDFPLIELAKNGPDAKVRAQNAATRINALLRGGVQMFEIAVSGQSLLGRGQLIAAANESDLKIGAGAGLWRANFGQLFWKERLNGRF